MNRFRACFLILGVLLLCAPAFPQGAPYAFVSSGTTTSTVYNDNTATTTVTAFALTGPGSDPEGMVLGPDNEICYSNVNLSP